MSDLSSSHPRTISPNSIRRPGVVKLNDTGHRYVGWGLYTLIALASTMIFGGSFAGILAAVGVVVVIEAGYHNSSWELHLGVVLTLLYALVGMESHIYAVPVVCIMIHIPLLIYSYLSGLRLTPDFLRSSHLEYQHAHRAGTRNLFLAAGVIYTLSMLVLYAFGSDQILVGSVMITTYSLSALTLYVRLYAHRLVYIAAVLSSLLLWALAACDGQAESAVIVAWLLLSARAVWGR